MSTIKLYDNAPYEISFTAGVVSCTAGPQKDTWNVILDQTLFFPEEGGQTPDRGMLESYPVVDVQIDSGGTITHTIRPQDPDRDRILSAFAQGRQVTGTIDWAHRYSNMQNHSGEHILSGLLHSLYGYENVGFHLTDHTVTLDTSGQLSDAQILDLERRANEVIYRNVPVTCEYPPPEVLKTLQYRSKKALSGPVRIVTIEGVDVCACCAPHVRHTGEVGLIRILNVLHTRTNMRLTILCGKRALLDAEHKQEQLEQISHQTNYPQDQAAAGVQKLLDEIAALKEQLRQLQSAALDEKTERIRSGLTSTPQETLAGQSLWLFEEPMDTLLQRRYMNSLCDLGFRFAGVFCGSDASGWKYLIGSRKDNANIPNQILRNTFQARGGGKPEMVQGSVAGSRAALEQALQTL